MQKINYTVSDGLAIIELNDPPVNTYSYEMMLEIDGAALAARMDPAVHVVGLRGAGEKFFCAGANIGMLKDADPEFKYYFCLHANETLMRFEQTPKLVIAALNGHTVDGGLEVAFGGRHPHRTQGRGQGRAAGSGAGRPARHRWHAAARPPGRQGPRAIELMATGRLMSFDEAASLGIVTHVWGDEELKGRTFADAVLEYARQFTPPNKASRAVGRMKRAVQTGTEAGFLEGLSIERKLQQLLVQGEDAKEGIAANLEKRKPEFKGR